MITNMHLLNPLSLTLYAASFSRLLLAKRLFLFVFILLILASSSGNWSSAYFSYQAMSHTSSVSRLKDVINDADIADAVQAVAETALLLCTVLAFAVVGMASVLRLRNAIHDLVSYYKKSETFRASNSEAATTGQHLLRQVLATTLFVFITFLLRSIFSTFNACPPLPPTARLTLQALQHHAAAVKREVIHCEQLQPCGHQR